MRYTLKSPVDVYLSLCCEEDYPRNPEAAKRWHVARNRGETWIMDENGDTVASIEREDAASLITSAPDLLAACEAALAWMHKHCAKTPDRFGGETVLVADLQLAIRAAKGGD